MLQPQSQPASKVGTVAEASKSNLKPVPWRDFILQNIPGENAPEREVVEYLQGLADCTTQQSFTLQQQQRLSRLVKPWFLHFIHAMQQTVPQDVVQRALIEGTPEDRKDKIVQQIPTAPALALVAAERGWQAEMKERVLQVVQREGPLPQGWAALLRSYRDPGFHTALRREFVADLATLRYWQSMPDLAPELPERLAAARATVLASPDLSKEPVAWALVDAGDGVIVDRLLHMWFNDGELGTSFAQAMKRYFRPPDGKRLGNDYVTGTLGRSAADYDYDPARRCWIRKPKRSKP